MSEFKFQDQTIFGNPHGNCFATTVANYLRIPLSDVPNFVEFGEGEWYYKFIEFMFQHGIYAHLCPPDEIKISEGEEWIANGMAERGLSHSVLMKGKEMLHDPHPSHTGLLSIRDMFVFFHIEHLLAPLIKLKSENTRLKARLDSVLGILHACAYKIKALEHNVDPDELAEDKTIEELQQKALTEIKNLIAERGKE